MTSMGNMSDVHQFPVLTIMLRQGIVFPQHDGQGDQTHQWNMSTHNDPPSSTLPHTGHTTITPPHDYTPVINVIPPHGGTMFHVKHLTQPPIHTAMSTITTRGDKG